MTETTVRSIKDTTTDEVDAAVAAAAAAAGPWAVMDRGDRAAALCAIAAQLDAHAGDLISLAMSETHLPEARLAGELTRTTFQLRLFAQVVRDGAFLDARIDTADPDWPMGAPRPDLRRMNVPLGPVVNFAASNFPFAFSVPGGDTASALAAGCPVIVKASPGHPALSRATFRLIEQTLSEIGAPKGIFAVIFGRDAGVHALMHPGVAAAAFTGSVAGGRALFDLASSRPVPIPFYGELGSINPVFVTEEAARTRATEIAAGLLTAVSSNAGQLCTKPGLVAVPESGPILKELACTLRTAAVNTGPMLNDAVAAGFVAAVEHVRTHPDVSVLAGGGAQEPLLLTTTAQAVLADPEHLFYEMFGPATLVIAYRDTAELLELARSVPGQLTASVFGDHADDTARELIAAATVAAGRVLWNSWPTGLSVTYAQQHGGPYPATTTPSTTSVGASAISRFLRPVVFQSVPEELLPAELRTDNPCTIPRSIDGALPR